MRRMKTLLLGLLAVAALTGCRKSIPEGPFPALSAPEAAREERDAIVVLSGSLAGKIAIENHDMRRDLEDRMEVFSNVRNRTHFPQAVDVQTAFKDYRGMAIDETAWKRLSLGPNETQTYSSKSIDSKPSRYTIRFRQGQ